MKRTGLLSLLTEQEMQRVEREGRRINLDAGDILHTPHDFCRGISFLCSGTLSINRMLPSGAQYCIRVLNAGETFGEMAAFSADALYPGWIIADSAAEVLELDVQLLLECLANRSFLTGYLEHLSVHTLSLLDKLEFLSLKTIRQKLASYILKELDKQQRISEHGAAMQLEVSRGTLSEMLGSSREAVSRVLAELEREGAIQRSRRRIEVKNPLLLERVLFGG
jgi:CRP/FNR family transcriptional regulator, dissimilatory nitrate respiration regulator